MKKIISTPFQNFYKTSFGTDIALLGGTSLRAMSLATPTTPTITVELESKVRMADDAYETVDTLLGLKVRARKDREVRMTGPDGTVRLNEDMVLDSAVHGDYLIATAKAAKRRTAAGSLKGWAKTNASLVMDKKHVEPKKLGNTLVSFEGSKKPITIVRTKMAALVKAVRHSLVLGQEDTPYTLCFGGHWAKLDDVAGDHGYPQTLYMARLEHHFDSIRSAGHMPEVYIYEGKAAEGKIQYRPNKTMQVLFFLDIRNMVGLCSKCNREKGEQYLAWLINHPYYGVDFVRAHFPLDYSTVIPRTRAGEGVGDAMMHYMLTASAIRTALYAIITPTVEEPEATTPTQGAPIALSPTDHLVMAREALFRSEDRSPQDDAAITQITATLELLGIYEGEGEHPIFELTRDGKRKS